MTTAQADVKEGGGFNAIWIIPIVALLLGIYMVVHTWLTEGPEITIAFDTAQGLTAGKTKVKYRNVEIGLVTDVELTDDFEGVVATVKMDYQARQLLKPDTRFWVVTARVSLGNVSGLDTLLSGAYIHMSPGVGGEPGTREYTALPRPPLTPTDAPGLRLHLLGGDAGSVSTGDAILYKGYEVGRVESSEFNTEDEHMHYQIFIDAPYDELVDSSVRFWNTSGISVSAGAEGLEVRTGSLDTVLLGGIEFGRPPDIGPGEPVEPEAEFKLYKSYEETLENPYRYGTHVVVRFTQSIKGLLPGAPVEYRGIRMGRVERLLIKEMISERTDVLEKTGTISAQGQPVPVLLYIEPGRFSLPDTADSAQLMQRIFETGVPSGLRASMETGNLLTGAKYIGFDYYPDEAGKQQLGKWLDYPVIPVIGGGFDQVLLKINAILDQVNKAPIEETITNANAAIAELDDVLKGLDELLNDESMQALPANLDATLRELEKTLEGLAPGSELYQNLNANMRQLNRTLDNMESLTRTLSNQPNAAIMPARLPPDPEPEAR